jgi:hypothetical protein
MTRKHGSFALEESLARLVAEGAVHLKEAQSRAAHPEEFDGALRALGWTAPPQAHD